ncbi:MAG: inositol-3-phosphate synthase [Bradyrhizobium sp.]|uniref:inositol-3-phosphate synthase n=1 Tax=Bradyrhizobium sp. TaxID=376 RepID=UPI001C28CAB7|nr:inositol-3-phosphate synthase [Bradyrhizobium sp.]MBU6461273.1 inositol-3-phosphate synthase [Pseudomonadota bacterium]MDE2065754.1 inositol-3-phosphate synthase [Bradyrhizobium sp.]MDE2242259.1 inositol-3-phosphate synthase [Bradyrhizobium sp.]MDE2470514.1 inositol-3-phosphate synthase [Bradyrhizobium sp.]
MGFSEIRTAIVGIGNCASSLIQGLHHYREGSSNQPMHGLMHPTLGGYDVGDIVVSAAFDVDAAKVGRDVSEAIFAGPNNTLKFAKVPPLGVEVSRGETLDGVGEFLRDKIELSKSRPANVIDVLKRTGSEIVVSYLPVGSQKASEYYANAAIEAGCAYVNCIPVFLASNPKWRKRFEERGLPIIGDDVKSQVGATITHRTLANLFRERGVTVCRTYQLNFGGNSDFLNMLERDRLTSKKISKTQAVVSQLHDTFDEGQIHVGPSDYVPWLQDRKIAHIRIEGSGFGGVPLNLELKLEVWDSPNSAGVVVDAVRCAKIALDRGLGGAILEASGYYMKAPPRQFTDDEARRMLLSFVDGESPGDGSAA